MKIFDHFKTAEDRSFWLRRLNGRPDRLPEISPRIVFRVASLGELSGAVPVIRHLRKSGFSGSITISVGTPVAYRKAKTLEILDPFTAVVPSPLENPVAIKTFLKAIQPDLFVNFETEYWPVLFYWLRQYKIPTILCNGRISYRSFNAYKSLSGLFSPIFSHFLRMGMVSDVHRERAILLGALPDSTFVTGSSKYDDLYERRSEEKLRHWRRKILGDNDRPVIVAGNLRGSECYTVLEAVKSLRNDFPDLLAILAPRHLHRVGDIIREAAKEGITASLLSSFAEKGAGKEKVTLMVVDFFGVLFELYGIADVTFCGGTFEPIGGHNIVEPAVWGKRVLYGPFIQKVEMEHNVLSNWGIGVMCRNKDELLGHLREMLKNRSSISGDEVTQALKRLSGASITYSSWIMEFFTGSKI